jgi:hypothetical protein
MVIFKRLPKSKIRKLGKEEQEKRQRLHNAFERIHELGLDELLLAILENGRNVVTLRFDEKKRKFYLEENLENV